MFCCYYNSYSFFSRGGSNRSRPSAQCVFEGRPNMWHPAGKPARTEGNKQGDGSLLLGLCPHVEDIHWGGGPVLSPAVHTSRLPVQDREGQQSRTSWRWVFRELWLAAAVNIYIKSWPIECSLIIMLVCEGRYVVNYDWLLQLILGVVVNGGWKKITVKHSCFSDCFRKFAALLCVLSGKIFIYYRTQNHRENRFQFFI